MATKKMRIKRRVLLAAVFLTVGVPLLINRLYQVPPSLVLIETVWEPVAVLEYYGTLLGIGLTALSIILAAKQAVDQIRHEQRYQHLMQIWKEMEEKIDQGMTVIHPMKLKGMALEVSTQNESPHRETLSSHIALYQMQAITQVDALSCSLTKVNNDELAKLISDIQAMRDKLVSIAEGYLKAIYTLKHSQNTALDQEKAKQNFFKTIGGFEKCLEQIYESEYLVHLKSKEEIFRKEYAQIVAEHPKLPLIQAIMAMITKESPTEEALPQV